MSEWWIVLIVLLWVAGTAAYVVWRNKDDIP